MKPAYYAVDEQHKQSAHPAYFLPVELGLWNSNMTLENMLQIRVQPRNDTRDRHGTSLQGSPSFDTILGYAKWVFSPNTLPWVMRIDNETMFGPDLPTNEHTPPSCELGDLDGIWWMRELALDFFRRLSKLDEHATRPWEPIDAPNTIIRAQDIAQFRNFFFPPVLLNHPGFASADAASWLSAPAFGAFKQYAAQLYPDDFASSRNVTINGVSRRIAIPPSQRCLPESLVIDLDEEDEEEEEDDDHYNDMDIDDFSSAPPVPCFNPDPRKRKSD
ncbi:hypothetical protein BKA62DRAFT_715188, partial [Auriculariales sp. MPI-PUGE-AT-0066]